jgi:linoleoyl-CoA desaturase
MVANDWGRYQLATTSNYAPSSNVFSWLIGGLNHQIEHHLLPHICHIHYKNLSPIVAQTAKEFGILYLTKKTFAGAVLAHIAMLRELGRMEMKSGA